MIEEWISELQNKTKELTQTEQKHEKKIFYGDILRDFGDIIKRNNIHIMGIPAGNDKEGEPENFLEEIVAEISLI